MGRKERQLTEQFAISARRYAELAARFGASGIVPNLLEETEAAFRNLVAAFEALKDYASKSPIRVSQTMGR